MNFLCPAPFHPHPLSLEELSATHVKVPCRTQVQLKGFGYLDPSLGTVDLPPGSELELPLWAVQSLSKKGFVSVRVPNKYREGYRDVLKADPTVVDLNRLGPHFYQTGLHLAALPTPDAEEIAVLLPEVFKERLIKLADSYDWVKGMRSADEGGNDAGTLMRESHLDVLEKSLLEMSKKGSQDMAMYFQRR